MWKAKDAEAPPTIKPPLVAWLPRRYRRANGCLFTTKNRKVKLIAFWWDKTEDSYWCPQIRAWVSFMFHNNICDKRVDNYNLLLDLSDPLSYNIVNNLKMRNVDLKNYSKFLDFCYNFICEIPSLEAPSFLPYDGFSNNGTRIDFKRDKLDFKRLMICVSKDKASYDKEIVQVDNGYRRYIVLTGMCVGTFNEVKKLVDKKIDGFVINNLVIILNRCDDTPNNGKPQIILDSCTSYTYKFREEYGECIEIKMRLSESLYMQLLNMINIDSKAISLQHGNHTVMNLIDIAELKQQAEPTWPQITIKIPWSQILNKLDERICFENGKFTKKIEQMYTKTNDTDHNRYNPEFHTKNCNMNGSPLNL